MKEATGELNMTVITIIAIGAVIAFFWLMWPQIKNTISSSWNNVGAGGSTECKGNTHYNASTGRCEAD